MFDVLFRKQRFQVLNRINSVLQRLQYSDSSLVRTQPTLKTLEKSTRSRSKNPFKKHFIENLFLNKFQVDVLEYPEIETIEEVNSLEDHCSIAKDCLIQISDSGKKSDEIVSIVKQLDLTALKLPVGKSGFGYLETEYSYMKEALSSKTSLAKTVLENEDFGIQLIDKFGSDSQKEKYLTKLSNSESLACFAHLESGPLVSLEPVPLDTKAVKTSDGQNYVVTGKKNWVYNASYADVLIFSANVQDSDEGTKKKFTLFATDKNLKGVTVHQPFQTVGLKGLDVCDVTFNEVLVPADCIIGIVHEGDELIKKVLSLGKLSNGAECITLMKKLINMTINHCIHNKHFKKNKYEKLLYKIKVGNLVSRLYAVESMTYLATGRVDSFDNADVFLESLIVKIFASESLQYVLKETLAILGNDIYSEDNTFNEILRDSHFFTACEDSNDHLKVVLSTAGLRHTLKYKAEVSSFEQLKRVLSLPNFRYRLHKKNYNSVFSLYSTSEYLKGYLHLAFEEQSVLLEDLVFKFSKTVEFLLSKYGNDVFNKHHDLKLLADLLVLIYAVTAVLGRASRAYCLAFRNQEIDYWSARSEVNHYHYVSQKIKESIEKETGFGVLEELGSNTIANKKYPRNFPIASKLSLEK